MALALTNLDITAVKGNAALLPNQPILQGCKVYASQSGTLVPGDIVALSTGGSADLIEVKKAAVTDEPIGVVVGNPIKTGFVAGDRVSVFPVNSYVYLPAGAASIARGSKLQFNSDCEVLATSTASNGYIGIAMTAGVAKGDLIIVQIQPGMEPAAA